MCIPINFIGAGKLGKTIGCLLVKHQLVHVVSVCNRTLSSALSAIQFIGDGQYFPEICTLPHAKITFIATPDDLILSTCAALSRNKNLKPDDIVVHFSGSLTSDLLFSVKNKGCKIASIHPMRSFAQPEITVDHYHGTYCAIEGDEEALHVITPLFESIGSVVYTINKEKKVLYHVAGVFSSNYLVTLAQQALSCMQAAGVEQEMAMRIIANLMYGTVSNLARTLSPEQSLTGPIQRGDCSILKKHLNALQNEEQKRLYASLGTATLPLTSLNEEKKQKIKEALELKAETELNHTA